MLNALSENFAPDGSDSLKIVDSAIPDAEKWNSESSWGENFTDSGLCWAASASNMLWISGWAERFINPATGQPFSSEDDIFAYYTKKFTDKGADVDRGIDWFFMGEFFINGTGSHANPRDFYDPQDGMMKEFVSSYAQKKYDLVNDPAGIGALERLDQNSSDAAVF